MVNTPKMEEIVFRAPSESMPLPGHGLFFLRPGSSEPQIVSPDHTSFLFLAAEAHQSHLTQLVGFRVVSLFRPSVPDPSSLNPIRGLSSSDQSFALFPPRPQVAALPSVFICGYLLSPVTEKNK